jgi:hypothetical protein
LSQYRMRPVPGWAVFVAGMYVGAAVVTFGFQTYIRLDHCSGYRACAVSLAKVSSGPRFGQRRGRYTPLDCNAVLETASVGGLDHFTERSHT